MFGWDLYLIIDWAWESGLEDREIRATLESAWKRVRKNPLYLLTHGMLPLPGLTPQQVRALQEQALHATWEDGTCCFPANASVGDRMGLKGGSWVNRLLKVSESEGYLIRVGKQRRGVINYRVSLPTLMRVVAAALVEVAKQVVQWHPSVGQNGAAPRQLALALDVDGGGDARASPDALAG